MINQIIKDYLSITELDNLKYSKALIFFQSPENSTTYIKLINEFYNYQLKNHTLNKIDILKSKDYLNDKIGLKLAFDISRFIEFLNAYAIIDKSIKPVVLHYSIIYLFDFISSCFIKSSTNNGRHGLAFKNTNDFLFCWNKIPGSDNNKLLQFLSKHHNADWVWNAEIVKNEDDRLICVNYKNNSLEIRCNKEKNKVNLIIDEKSIDLYVNEKNGKLNIYKQKGNEDSIVLRKSGIFPRIIDSLHLIGYPSIFSNTNDQTLENSGIGYHIPLDRSGYIDVDSDYNDLINNIDLILKGRYGYFNEPKIELKQIIDIYNMLSRLYQFNEDYVKNSNFILIDYLFLFAASSISRYRAEDWHKIQTDKNSVIMHHFEIAQFNFIYKWIPYLICEIIVPKEVLYELEIY